MAVTVLSVLIATLTVAYCFPAAFQDLEESRSKYHITLTFTSLTYHNQKPQYFVPSVPLTGNRTSIKFLAVGDWGGVPYPPYITGVQKTTAQEMSKIADEIGADFILALGDNFYYTGVDTVDSPRFRVS